MNKPTHYVGIDIASTTFTSAVGQMGQKWHLVVKSATFDNTLDGFKAYLAWLKAAGVNPENGILCMEATGVYGELLAHFLVANHYPVSIEPPLKVKRAFVPEGHKSDAVDCGQISEYAYRFFDELSLWTARTELLEQIKTLLATREEFVVEKAAHQHALTALKRKAIRTPMAEGLHETAMTQLKAHIQAIEAEIKRLIGEDPSIGHTIALLMTIPGVGLLLAAHLLLTLQRAPQPLSPKDLAAYVGICPYENSSGTSIYHTPTSRHYGPPGLRKLLFLAALSLRTHNQTFRSYFLRKTQAGKPAKLVINNIANKLLKIVVAVVRSDVAFIPDYRSVNPRLLKPALTYS
jgi:transposase